MALDITGLGSVFDFGSKIIDKIWPNAEDAARAKLAMLELQQKGEFKELELNFELAKAQIGVNAEEAKNPSLFVSGWRPAVGWVCVSAYAFNYLIMPIANWIARWIDVTAPAIIALDTGELTTLLFGMLGIGTLRTIDKIKGVAK
jgi:hypothetical protein